MARRTHTVVTDDIDGSEGAATINFSFEGVYYEIDLNEENSQKLRDELAGWMKHARRVGGRGRRGTSRRRSDETKRIREWARANGHEVGDRGRIPAVIRQAYSAAS